MHIERLIAPAINNSLHVGADRACARSAIHSKHFKISIRAEFGEHEQFHQKSFRKAIDNLGIRFTLALEMLAVRHNKMRSDEIVRQLTRHICSHASKTNCWFVGIRLRPRIHPWDEMELPYPTCALVDFHAASPREAKIAIRELLGLGIAREHEGETSPHADHVFAYALQRN
jgi:hypothetical protein